MTVFNRRWLRVAVLLLLLSVYSAKAASSCERWPQWQAFKQAMLSADGRVIDASTPQLHTVSEGQAYALFFALVADDREAFAKILRWTENNLAQGDLTAHLPAWQWGKNADGKWGVLDRNPASDADLWIAYALGEAGRLWNIRHYRILSLLIARRVLREETARIPDLGLSLLPGPVGFTLAKDQWRLNPSYVPLQQLRWLVQNDPDEPAWPDLLKASRRLLVESAPLGFSPDWAIYQTGRGFLPDVQTQASGSYNSIRVYLWAGMMSEQDPLRAGLLKVLQPMARYVATEGGPPESVNITTGKTGNHGPPGFSAAVLPFLAALGETDVLRVQLKRSSTPAPAGAPAYYDSVLRLFGHGFHEGRFRFDANGRVQIDRQQACNAAG